MKNNLNDYKASLNVNNSKYKVKSIDSLVKYKDLFICNLPDLYSYWKEQNKINRFIIMAELIGYLSVLRDKELIELLKPFGFVKRTLPKFVDYNHVFKDLDKFQSNSKYVFHYNYVWPYYIMYSDLYIKYFLAQDYDLDILEIGRKINRQRQNLSYPIPFQNLENELVTMNQSYWEDFPFKISDKNPIRSVAHVYAYPHKSVYKSLFNELKHINMQLVSNDFNEGDYKVDFYDLLEIILRNKTLLNKNHKRIDDSYHNIRQHKVLTVNSILSL